MNTKLYVGNIPFEVTQTDLEDHFAKEGTVKSARIIMDRDTGRAKGFGFVEMESSEDAESAQKNLDGIELMGRPLRVSEARERTESRGFAERRQRY